jgi:antitoxin (DNA-binding transcriptional repressor) of toxin-antitoxin stability system
MAVKTLSVTEASRSFSDFVNRVYSRKESFAIAKLGVPYALLVPAGATGCTSHELATDLASANLPAEDRRHIAAAIRKGRKALKPLKNPWG